MKILYLMPYPPYPPIFGGALREYNLLKILSKNNRVTLVTFGGPNEDLLIIQNFGDYLDEIRIVPQGVIRRNHRMAQIYALFSSHSYDYIELHSSRMQKQLNTLFKREKYDLIQTGFPVMVNYVLNTTAPKILDKFNIEYDTLNHMSIINESPFRRMYYHLEYKRMRDEEVETLKKHDLIFTTSKNDKIILDREVPDVPKYILPNGVDTNYFHPLKTKKEPHSIVFTGMMGYVPNYDAMLFFIDEILPLIRIQIPDIKLYIVGKRPPKKLKKRSSDNIIITGFVEDVRPFVWRSGVYIAPIRIRGGTHQKILEALSMKMPVVSTSIGCEGIDVKDKESIRIADKPDQFAEIVVDLLKKQQHNDPVVNRGYELVKELYEWEIVGKKMQDIYQTIMNVPRNQLMNLFEWVDDLSGW